MKDDIDIRDYFAAKAIQGLLLDYYSIPFKKRLNDDRLCKISYELIAKYAYDIADAMLIERQKSNNDLEDFL